MATSQLTRPAVPAARAADIADVAGQLTLENLPGRDLTPEELRALAATLAADPARWSHLVGFDDDERVYASLHRDAHVDVWLLCWTPVNDTGWHDHDVSSGAVAVVAGELAENNLAIGSQAVETRVCAGTAFCFGPDHIHRLNGATPGSQPLRRLELALTTCQQLCINPVLPQCNCNRTIELCRQLGYGLAVQLFSPSMSAACQQGAVHAKERSGGHWRMELTCHDHEHSTP